MEIKNEIKINVLQVMNAAGAGGVSAVVLNYYKALDRTKVHFDFAMADINLGKSGKEFEALGCKFYKLPLKSKHPFKYRKCLKKILIDGKYDAIHVHGNETSFYPLYIAKKAKIKIRIAHAHTARKPVGIINKLKRLMSIILTKSVATNLLACTRDAACSIFGKKSLSSDKLFVLKNAIDTKSFVFDSDKREKIRQELGLQNNFCICCVGALEPVKNHKFALQIFKEVLEAKPEARLVMVGDGSLRNDLEQNAIELGISDKVLFLGRRNDVCDLLKGMDSFIMPSLYEGFAIAGLEAAATGLPIYLSDRIPADLSFYSQSHYLSLDDSTAWANQILSCQSYDRTNGVIEVREAGFEIQSTAKDLQCIYANKQ